MTIDYFISKTWRYFSLAGLIIILFLKYFSMPENVTVHYNEAGLADGLMPKNQIFNLFATLIILINVFPLLLIAPFKKLSSNIINNFSIVKKWQKDREAIDELFSNCVSLFIGGVNTLLILCLFIIGRLNDLEYKATIAQFSWLIYFGIGILIFISIYPFYKLTLTQPHKSIKV